MLDSATPAEGVAPRDRRCRRTRRGRNRARALPDAGAPRRPPDAAGHREGAPRPERRRPGRRPASSRRAGSTHPRAGGARTVGTRTVWTRGAAGAVQAPATSSEQATAPDEATAFRAKPNESALALFASEDRPFVADALASRLLPVEVIGTGLATVALHAKAAWMLPDSEVRAARSNRYPSSGCAALAVTRPWSPRSSADSRSSDAGDAVVNTSATRRWRSSSLRTRGSPARTAPATGVRRRFLTRFVTANVLRAGTRC